jgi:hypothetical protein
MIVKYDNLISHKFLKKKKKKKKKNRTAICIWSHNKL